MPPGIPVSADPIVRLRSAETRDLPFLREMLFEAAFWRMGHERPDLESGLATPELAKLLEGWGDRAGDLGVIAEAAGGARIGAAWLRYWSAESHSYGFVAPDVPELGVAVRRQARRGGVGERLLRALLEDAARRGATQVSLSVEPDNPAANLYARLGFRRVEVVGGAWTMVAAVGGA